MNIQYFIIWISIIHFNILESNTIDYKFNRKVLDEIQEIMNKDGSVMNDSISMLLFCHKNICVYACFGKSKYKWSMRYDQRTASF